MRPYKDEELFDTPEQAADHAVATLTTGKYGWKQTNIFHDPETGRYYADFARSVTILNVGQGHAVTHERMATCYMLPNGTHELVHKGPRLIPGDIEYAEGRVSHVHPVGDPLYRRYYTRCARRGVRMPSFRKEMREIGYEIVEDDPQRRVAVARKPQTQGEVARW